MTLDDLMEVWRSQDAAPLHGVNETLLRLALRQDEAKLQARRRRERWFTYFLSAGIVAGMALFLAIMIYPYDDDVLTGWDYAIPIVGAAAALLSARAVYGRHRAQAVREQRFGESLRDQINRQIAQLDYGATGARLASLLGTVPLPIVCAFAIILASWRINDRPFSDAWLGAPIIVMIFWITICVGASFWWQRRSVQRDVLPRKRRLEALLKEFDAS
jgi:peptidoglycan/LPS O-acetylase OafA/YrhL